MTIMTDNAAIEQTISDNSFALMELEYYLTQIPDITDLEARLSAMELKQMELMIELANNNVSIGEFNDTLGDENSGLVMQVNVLSWTAAAQKV